MSEGYKVTELGDIPESWEVVQLGDVIHRIVGGGTPPRENKKFWKGRIPWATVKDLKKTILYETEEYISEEGLGSSASNLIPAFTLIVATRMALGKAVFFKKDVAINQDLKAIFPGELLDKIFLFHWYLANAEFISGLGTGSTVKGIRLELLKALKAALPPLPEQQKIASILSTVDERIEVIDAQISRTQELKKGLMQQLLSEGIGHTKFKSSELGDIPESWEVVRLSKIIKSLSSGVSVNLEDRVIGDNEYGVLKTSAVLIGRFYPQYHKAIIPADINRATLNPKKDTILISRMNTPSLVGESGYVYEDFKRLFIPDRIWMAQISNHDEVNVRWLSFVLASPKLRGMISLIATGTSNSMKNIAKPAFLGLKIALPPKEDQVKIGSILSAVEEKLGSLQSRKETYQQLKKGLMQQLLTGKIRVNTSHNEPALA